VIINSSILNQYFDCMQKIEEINEDLKFLADFDTSLELEESIFILKQIKHNKKFIQKIKKFLGGKRWNTKI